MLSWLNIAENRNIVTGAAGSAQNGGGMSGSKNVTSKDAGWGMLAAHLTKTCGVQFDKKQAQNKFTYLEKKFHAAKLWQNTSGVGVSEEDRVRGITSIPEKLTDMCPNFELWESWFGNNQKYSPASIVQSGLAHEGDGGTEAEGDQSPLRDNGFDVDELGGPDGKYDDAVEKGAEQSAHNNDGVAEESGDSYNGPNGDAIVAGSVGPGPPSPSVAASGHGGVAAMTSPAGSVGRGVVAGGRGRGTGANSAAVAQQKAALTLAVMNRPANPGTSSPSQSSGSSGKNSFDGVYADAAKNKCATMMDISRQRNVVEGEHQVAEHAFRNDDRRAQHAFQKALELEKQAQEHKFQQQQKALQLLSDRQEALTKKQIEYDKTLASLLVADKTGKLADDFESRRDRERTAAASAPDPVAMMLQQFMPDLPRPRNN